VSSALLSREKRENGVQVQTHNCKALASSKRQWQRAQLIRRQTYCIQACALVATHVQYEQKIRHPADHASEQVEIALLEVFEVLKF
jgi:hypothetical protein